MSAAGKRRPSRARSARAAALLAAVGTGLAALALAATPASATETLPPRDYGSAGSGTPLLPEGDAVELANQLADAAAVQDVCYGWTLDVDDDWSYDYDGSWRASNGGLGMTPSVVPGCDDWVLLTFTVAYQSNSSELEDSASVSLATSGTLDLDEYSILDRLAPYGATEDALLGDQDDMAIRNSVAALPLVVAEDTNRPAVRATPDAMAVPAADHPTDSPHFDYLRTYLPHLGVAAFLLVVGVGAMLLARSDAVSLAHGHGVHRHGGNPRPRTPTVTKEN